MSVDRITCRVHRRIIVRVDDVTCSASAVAVITWLVVRAGEAEQRIEQTGFLETQKNRVGAQQRAESSLSQFHVRLSWFFFQRWNSNFRFFLAAAFENAEHVAGLGNFPALDGFEVREHALQLDFLGRRGWKRYKSLRLAVG